MAEHRLSYSYFSCPVSRVRVRVWPWAVSIDIDIAIAKQASLTSSRVHLTGPLHLEFFFFTLDPCRPSTDRRWPSRYVHNRLRWRRKKLISKTRSGSTDSVNCILSIQVITWHFFSLLCSAESNTKRHREKPHLMRLPMSAGSV